MKRKLVHKQLAMAGLCLLAWACGADQPLGPPAIRYGQDVCSGCGMILSDERFASAIVEAGADQPPLLFDDIGCMIDYERRQPAAGGRRYVHDADSHQWIAASQARFVKTARHTPMGSGLLAFADRSRALALTHPSDSADQAVKTYDQLLREPAQRTDPQ